jgi:hypothetical protein
MTINGAWAVHTVDGAVVRLRSGRVRMMTIDVTAPVSGGELDVSPDAVHLALRLELDQLRTRHFLMQAAARSLVSRNDAGLLVYRGEGIPGALPWQVRGRAQAGSVAVQLELAITPCGPAADPMAEIELRGSANVGTVHLPLPGLGTVEDFSFDVDARLAMRPRHV